MDETHRGSNLPKTHKAIVIHSPHSGRAAQFTEALAYLRQTGIEIVNVLSIAELDNLPAQGERWVESGIDIAVAAGGDGLVGGVITHIAESGLPLGILPLGTANDIARSLNIPQDLRRAAEVIAQGRGQEIDIGTARPAEQAPHLANPEPGHPAAAHVPLQKSGFFAHALTVGLNVQFARLATNVATRQRYGKLTYPFAALEVLRNHAALEMQFEFHGLALFPHTTSPTQLSPVPLLLDEPTILRCRALQAAVINAPIFGGQWQLSIPGARLNDRLLDIVVIEDVELGSLSARFARLFSQQEQRPTGPSDWHARYPMLHPAELTGIPGVHHVQAQGVTITTQVDPQDVTLDGEVRGQTPIHVCMADERLWVIVPG